MGRNLGLKPQALRPRAFGAHLLATLTFMLGVLLRIKPALLEDPFEVPDFRSGIQKEAYSFIQSIPSGFHRRP